MTYNLHYHIVSITYRDNTRVTRVGIVNESTGELFYGEARRNPRDEMDVSLGVNLATLRAVRQAILQDLADDKNTIIDEGSCCDFQF